MDKILPRDQVTPMATVILDPELAERLRAERAAWGGDRYDEVWEGTYMMAPMPNNEHQAIVNGLTAILQDIIGSFLNYSGGTGICRPPVGRIVFKAAVIRWIVRRSNHNAICQSGRFSFIEG